MKISCLLSSYNRPKMIRQALSSLEDQTYRNFEVIVLDDGSDEIRSLSDLGIWSIPRISFYREPPIKESRMTDNRLGKILNKGLGMISGDLVCYLCDDDYYFPDWFGIAARFFRDNTDISAIYGKLIYSESLKMEFPREGKIRFPGVALSLPQGQIDHNQFMHRRFSPPYRWPEDEATIMYPDALYMEAVAKDHPFHPIEAWAAVKRMHDKNLQRGGILREARE